MTFKVGDKVALVGSPTELYGIITSVDPIVDWCDIQVHNIDGSKASTARRASDGHVVSGPWAEAQIVPWIDPAPPKPKFFVLTPKGHQLCGEEISVVDGDIRMVATATGGSISLLVGDTLYKRVGKVVREHVTEEDVPIQPGYKYTTGNGYETTVFAIHDEYAFIQCSRDGVAGGCTTIRIANIPKQKRQCNKHVNKLVKDKE